MRRAAEMGGFFFHYDLRLGLTNSSAPPARMGRMDPCGREWRASDQLVLGHFEHCGKAFENRLLDFLFLPPSIASMSCLGMPLLWRDHRAPLYDDRRHTSRSRAGEERHMTVAFVSILAQDRVGLVSEIADHLF